MEIKIDTGMGDSDPSDEGGQIRSQSLEQKKKKLEELNSRSAKLRLISLVALLGVVLFAMSEAGKPERWAWMGFGKVQPQEPTEIITPNGVVQTPESIAAADSKQNAQGDAKSGAAADDSQDMFPEITIKFWREIFYGLKDEKLRELFRITRAVRTASPVYCEDDAADADNESLNELIQQIDREHKRFQERGLAELSLMQGVKAADEMERVSAGMSEIQELWAKKIQPAFEAAISGGDFTISQQKTVERLQRQILDPLAFEEVLDLTSVARAEGGNAWLRIWEKTLNPEPDTDYLPVTHIQLSSQPKIYRDATVKVNGWIRSAQRVGLGRHEIGLEQYYILWLKPKESNVSPFCVYCANLPDGFPAVGDKVQELNENVEVKGVFFKIRTYQAADETVRNAPLVVARDLTWNPRLVATESKWQPPKATVWLSFLLLPLMAAWFAWRVYSVTLTRRPEPGAERREQIEDTLEKLADDPTIQTDLEKVQSLESED